jgi:ABC-type phosphate/phosphonate transport system substrate-binding protein
VIDGLHGLKGRRLALGSKDSAQAAILPVHFLEHDGPGADAVDVVRINSDVGKHGDTGRSELDALREVLEDRADAAAIGVNTWEAIGREELMPGGLEAFWESPTYSHCNFTVLDDLSEERTAPWLTRLMAMDWDNPEHRPILEMEGLRAWVEPRLEGYQSLFAAVAEQDISPRW